MNRSLFKGFAAVSGVSAFGLLFLSGCGATPFQSPQPYHSYDPVTPAAVVWPSPAGPAGAVPLGESDQAQPAGYHEGVLSPTTAPAKVPVTLPSEAGLRT